MRPDLLVLTELELWPNLIAGARATRRKDRRDQRPPEREKLSRLSVSAVAVQRVLSQVDLVAVQNDDYAERFLSLGTLANAVHRTGSIKFDGAQTDRNNPQTQRLAQLAGIGGEDVVFLAGSTQEAEESLALPSLSAWRPSFHACG